MACRYTIDGKTYEDKEFHDLLRSLPLTRLSKYVPSITPLPEMPFAKTWHELAMKRVLRYAAEQGYDKVAWTTGAQQAERYDLSKHVDAIHWYADRGTIDVIQRGDRFATELAKNVTWDTLADYVGKEAAERLRDAEELGGAKVLTGLDLKIGGEGMRGFYDQILPGFLNQYGKKWGARVGTADLVMREATPQSVVESYTPEQRAIAIRNRDFITKPDTLRVAAVAITPAMRRSVLEEGQPLFMATRQPEESDASWNQRWKAAFASSWQADVRLLGSPFRLTDTLTERSSEALAQFAGEVEYLAGLGNAIQLAVERVQDRLGETWRRADFAGFDTGVDDLGVNLPAGLVGAERNHILINPWGALAEAQRRFEHEPRIPLAQWFGEEMAETVAHEVSHQRFRDHGLVFERTVDWVVRQAEEPLAALSIQSQAWLEEGEIHARFTRDYDRLRVLGRPGAPAGTPEGPTDLAFGEGAEGRDIGRRPIAALGPRTPRSSAAGGVQPEGDLGLGGERREGALPVGAAAPIQLPAGRPAFRSPLTPYDRDRDVVERVRAYGQRHPREKGYEAWAEAMRRDLGPQVSPYLERAWREAEAPTRERPVAPPVPAGQAEAEAPRPEAEVTQPLPPAPPQEPPPPRRAPDFPESIPPAMERIIKKSQKLAGDVRTLADRLGRLNAEASQVAPQAETIAQTGTLAPEARAPFRRVAPKPDTFTYRFSEQDIADGQAALVALVRDYRRLQQDVNHAADPFSIHTARNADIMLGEATARLNAWSTEFRRQRFAAGRAVYRFNRPVPEDMIAALRDAGVAMDWLQRATPRLPIYTNIQQSLRRYPTLSESERAAFGRDLVDAWRLNLFAVTSWTLDFVGNTAEIGHQITRGLGYDLMHAARGTPSFPSIQGIFRAIRERVRHRGEPVAAEVEAAFGRTIGGERVGGRFTGALTGTEPGTFTRRTTAPSRALDLLVGTPLYAKGAVDLGAKRLMATATGFREAIMAADRAGIKGVIERQRFLREFMDNLPDESVERMIEAGNKAGFNRPLSRFEEAMSRSVLVRLFGDVFARWPFQFTRTMGEWLGVNPSLWRRARAGQASAEEIAGYLVAAAAGWGALLLLDDWLYDRVDFNSMEYIHEDSSRTRLSNRDPLPTALWLLAVIHLDEAKATGALRYASVPGARLLSGEGGLLGSLLSIFTQAAKNADVNPRALERAMTDTVNRLIPGQALLSAVETLFDPVIREGIGANVPGVSSFLPEAIQRTTGEALAPRQRLPFTDIEFPAIGGTPIPGARRILDPVERLLSRYGLMVYRGPQSPIAGLHPSEVPGEILREWVIEFGRERKLRLSSLAEAMDRGAFTARSPDRVREQIQTQDALAARIATNRINARYGTPRRLPRRPTVRERRGPEVFEEERRRFEPVR